MSIVAIRAALESVLDGMSPPLDTAWENTPFTPVAGTPYQRVFLLPGTPDNPEFGQFTQERGLFQISLAYPLDTGPGEAAARADLIRATFFRGRSIAYQYYGDVIVTTIETTPEVIPGQIEDDRYVIKVRARFYCNYFSNIAA